MCGLCWVFTVCVTRIKTLPCWILQKKRSPDTHAGASEEILNKINSSGKSPVGFLPFHPANKNATTKTVDTKKEWTIHQGGWAYMWEGREGIILTLWGWGFCGSKVKKKPTKLGLWDWFLVCANFVFLLVCILCLSEMWMWDGRFWSVCILWSKAKWSINPVAGG